MRIGELAERAKVSVRSLRYYEQQGLLTPERSDAGQRLYSADAVERVRFFQDMFAAGLSSKRIAELLPCMDLGHTDVQQRAMLHTERERVQEKLDQLTSTLRRLDDLIEITADHP